MSFNSPTPPFPPPAPARKSRAGGLILILAGALGAASPFIAWFPAIEGFSDKLSLKAFVDKIDELEEKLGTASTAAFHENPQNWFYAILGGAALAALFGLIALISGGKGANLTAGIFGLLAAAAIVFPPVWLITGADSVKDLANGLGDFEPGFYMASGAGFLALIGMLFAFIGAAKK